MTPKTNSWREYAEGLVHILQAHERLLADADKLAEAAIIHTGMPALYKAAQVYRDHRQSLHAGARDDAEA